MCRASRLALTVLCSFSCAIVRILQECGCQTPHCATRFPPYFAPRNVSSSLTPEAILTFLTGLAIIGKRIGESPLGAAGWSTPWAITILTGALFGTLMFFNVVLVIWPKQQIVIASAKAVASGGVANAVAPAAARRAFLASRTNVVFSIPMLFYMGAASHFTLPGGGNHAAYWAGVIVVAALLEINSLAATTGATTKPIEKIPGVIVTGFVVWAVVYGLARAFLSA